jgi:hypothetical protein
MNKVRRAVVRVKPPDSIATIERYLPDNYGTQAVGISDSGLTLVEGEDVAGWTLDGYVIPRLASGLIIADEVLDVRKIVLPHSEVCMHMKVAGKRMVCGLLPGATMVQLYDEDGRHFSAPITAGEAGWLA